MKHLIVTAVLAIVFGVFAVPIAIKSYGTFTETQRKQSMISQMQGNYQQSSEKLKEYQGNDAESSSGFFASDSDLAQTVSMMNNTHIENIVLALANGEVVSTTDFGEIEQHSDNIEFIEYELSSSEPMQAVQSLFDAEIPLTQLVVDEAQGKLHFRTKSVMASTSKGTDLTDEMKEDDFSDEPESIENSSVLDTEAEVVW